VSHQKPNIYRELRISSLKLVLQFQLSQITMPSVSNYLSLPL